VGFDASDEYIQKILSVISCSDSPNVKIEFQGGEPLLSFGFVKRFVDMAETMLQGKVLSFVICSALGPLNEEIINWAVSRSIDFSVSLDGPNSVHANNRPSKYFNSYEKTLEGVSRIRAQADDRISCLTTITRASLHKAKQIVEEYFNLGLNSIFLRPLSPFGFASQQLGRIGYDADEFFVFYQEAMDYVVQQNDKRLFIEDSTMIHLRKLFQPGVNRYADLQSPSGYALSAIVFNYDGKVFGSDEARMLWESTKSTELVLGDINSAKSLSTNIEFSTNLLSDTFICELPGCDECAFNPYCGADPLFHLSTQGDHIGNKSISFYCQLERKVFDFIIEKYCDDPLYRKVFDNWLKQ